MPSLNYVPPNGELHPVTAKDDWWKLAALPKVQGAKPGMTALELCRFNFQTTDPAEINWYLRNKAGCTQTTPDKKNYRFAGGEKIYIPTKGNTLPAGRELPSFLKVQQWFETEIIPQRTTSAGFSPNRIYKSPMALVNGNKADPNGLCGDAAEFVAQEFKKRFGGDEAAGNHTLGNVVWVLGYAGLPFTNMNHVANALIPRGAHLQEYDWDSKASRPVGKDNFSNLQGALLSLRVFDLYYKKPLTLGNWWRGLSSSYSGTIYLML